MPTTLIQLNCRIRPEDILIEFQEGQKTGMETQTKEAEFHFYSKQYHTSQNLYTYDFNNFTLLQEST